MSFWPTYALQTAEVAKFNVTGYRLAGFLLFALFQGDTTCLQHRHDQTHSIYFWTKNDYNNSKP